MRMYREPVPGQSTRNQSAGIATIIPLLAWLGSGAHVKAYAKNLLSVMEK